MLTTVQLPRQCLAMAAGTAGCQIAVNSITNSLGGNPIARPILRLYERTVVDFRWANAVNGVTNQCLVVATQKRRFVDESVGNVLPGSTFVFRIR